MLNTSNIVSTEFVLDRGERQLWAGIPRQGIALRPSDVFLIPFSLLWAGFAFFWEFKVITMGAPWFFALFGLPFVIIGLHITIGRFIVDALRRRNTSYAVTSDRILIESGIRTLTLTSLALSNLTDVSLRERADGTGTITFGASTQVAMMRGLASWPNAAQPIAFEMIPDVRRVYDIIREAQKESAKQ